MAASGMDVGNAKDQFRNRIENIGRKRFAQTSSVREKLIRNSSARTL
jgi:hypothetical protein